MKTFKISWEHVNKFEINLMNKKFHFSSIFNQVFK